MYDVSLFGNRLVIIASAHERGRKALRKTAIPIPLAAENRGPRPTALSPKPCMMIMRLGRPTYTEPMQGLKQTCYFARNRISLVNKSQNKLNKLSLDANSMAISHWQA